MIIEKIENNSFDDVARKAAGILQSGGIVISPTDTVYGVLGNAKDEIAVRKIFALKNRPMEKAFPIFVRNVAEARKYAYISDTKARFLEKVWPGPITIVFHHKEKFPAVLTGGKETIGLRVPDSALLLDLLARIDFPLAQTSANKSDKPPAKNIQEIREYFEGWDIQPDLVIDGGELAGTSSTVIDFTGNSPMVLRAGIVTKDDLDRILNSMQ